MKAFLALSAERRRNAFLQMEQEMGLQAFSVEKDFWVCWTLRELFGLPDVGEHLTFKGGTSLSKAWGLIERFSEDIDLIVAKELFGYGDDAAPDKAPSKKQSRLRLDSLQSACRDWVQGTLQPGLGKCIAGVLGPEGWRLEVDANVADGHCLLFSYPSVLSAQSAGYVSPWVKLELGARSDDWPHVERSVIPYVLERFPVLDREGASMVRVLAAERTFWEKVCLLHEETFRPTDKPRPLRIARHYYDLWCLLRAGVGKRALVDFTLFAHVVEHRKVFFRYTWVDYETHRPGSLRLLPASEDMRAWKADYEAMRGAMFFGEAPPFAEILKVVAEFEKTFNSAV